MAATVSIIFIQNLIYVVIIFGAYSLVLSLIWQQFNAPDIAITEAVVGVFSTILMVTVVSKVRGL